MLKYRKIRVGKRYIEAVLIKLLSKNFILLKGKKGYIMCGYLNLNVAEKFKDAAIKITGISSIKQALEAKVSGLTRSAKRLGIYKGQPVRDVIRIIAGFTLIEIMLVVIIIGILVAMVVPRLAGRSEEARNAVARADIDANIAIALDLYELDMGTYPSSLSDLRTQPAESNNWKGPYLKKTPSDPWGRQYIYKFPGTHNADGYDLYSLGRDGSEGGGDDITNWE